MFTRRLFLGSVVATLAVSRLAAFDIVKPYRVGIADTMLPAQADDDLKESFCGTFEIRDRPRAEIVGGTAADLLQKLDQDELHLAVVNGVEYAWHQAKNPGFTPLVAAFTTGVKMKACLVAPCNSPIKQLNDLRGKCVAFPERLPHHAHLYVQHVVEEAGIEPKGFLGRHVTPTNSEEGIESVIDAKCDAILLDGDAWQAYQERKPARSKKLKVVMESPAFPTPVVLYHQEHASKVEMKLLQTALCLAHQKRYARQLFNFWGIARFVLCGNDYQQVIDGILKTLPKPMTPTILAKS
jgi:ABC-type phosphate/phosphonate transport system substrate-binding protein